MRPRTDQRRSGRWRCIYRARSSSVRIFCAMHSDAPGNHVGQMFHIFGAAMLYARSQVVAAQNIPHTNFADSHYPVSRFLYELKSI